MSEVVEQPAVTEAPAEAPAPAAPAAPAKSLMEKGQAAAAAPATPEAPNFPDKFLVKTAEGAVDWRASAIKAHAEGYAPLEKRLHSGDAPPKSPDEYAPELPEGLSLDTLKSDPLYQGFLKGAHSRGINNAQLGWVLQSYAERLALQSSPEAAEAELRKTWSSDEALNQGLASSYRAVKAFAGDDQTFDRLQAKFGNDPDFIRFTAKIAPELREDRASAGLTPVESETLESLMGSQAYLNAKDPQHTQVVAKVRSLYAKKFPT
jgi:hypothetical protein